MALAGFAGVTFEAFAQPTAVVADTTAGAISAFSAARFCVFGGDGAIGIANDWVVFGWAFN